jgi:lauroyl/myristoyl acyltransferase
VTHRHLFTWKFWFYDVGLPLLRRLGPARADALLGTIGSWLARVQPKLRAKAGESLARARAALDADWDGPVLDTLLANVPRFLARDYPLDTVDDELALSRFDVTGLSHLDAALADGRGLVLVGSHLGAHVAGLHWLHRQGVPVRLLVQRPKHISRTLQIRFDRPDSHPQAKFFLRRGLTTGEAADRILRARAALRDGLAVYLNGDIPWTGPNARPGTLLGLTRPFLAVWTDLAVLARSPVIFVTCVHAPRGRFAIDFSPPLDLAPGDENRAVTTYLAHLETAITAHPADAVAHLTWPCFGPGIPVMPCERKRDVRSGRSNQHL